MVGKRRRKSRNGTGATGDPGGTPGLGKERPMKKVLSILLLAALAGAALLGCEAFERYGASKFGPEGVHRDARGMTPEKCFECHREGVNGAPKAPESMLGRTNCVGCHLSE
jgi:hypothetical protein